MAQPQTTGNVPVQPVAGSQKSNDPNSYWRKFLTIYLFVITIILGVVFAAIWDNRIDNKVYSSVTIEKTKVSSIKVNDTTIAVPDSLLVFPKSKLTSSVNEGILILMIMIVGGFGAILHAIVSLGVFIGNNSFQKEWNIWYLYRPLVGALLSLLVYFIIRAGFITSVDPGSGIYSMLGVAGLVGMFSKQAQEKLGDIFDVLFQSKKAEQYSGKLVQNNPVPKIESVNPESLESGSDDAPITVTGSGFIKSSAVRVNNQPVTTEFSSATELKAIISDMDTYDTDSLRVRVFNGTPGGGLSDPVIIKLVKPAAPPQPNPETTG